MARSRGHEFHEFQGHHEELLNDVDELLGNAGAVTRLHPSIVNFLCECNQKRSFQDAMSKQVSLIQTRSQALEDGRVTIFDKAFLTLTKNGRELGSIIAIDFFCKEYLGLNDCDDDLDRRLREAVSIRTLTANGKSRLMGETDSRANDRQIQTLSQGTMAQVLLMATPDR